MHDQQPSQLKVEMEAVAKEELHGTLQLMPWWCGSVGLQQFLDPLLPGDSVEPETLHSIL